MPLTFGVLSEVAGLACSESLPCSDTLQTTTDLGLVFTSLIESGAAVACSETRACSNTTQTCSDAGVGLTPLLEV